MSSTNKFKAAISAIVLGACIGTGLFLQHRANQALRGENDTLLTRVSRLNELEAENGRLSKQAASVTNRTAPDEEKIELVRLRGEVTRLRTDTAPNEKLRKELDRLQSLKREIAPVAAPSAAPLAIFPRETWTFSGYGTPQAAILSLTWASFRGDLDSFFKSMSAEEQARIRNQWERSGKSDADIQNFLVNYWGKTKSVRIENQQTISPDEMVLTLFFEREDGGSQRDKMKVRRINNEWKMNGTLAPETVAEPAPPPSRTGVRN